jgi:LacI family transcriptional regulator
MKDVAARAGVSVSTVSRVLNNTKPVGRDLRARVMEAVEELDFRPNQHARWLAAKKSNVVGLIMPSVNDSDGAQFLHTCSMRLKEQGYDIMVGLTAGEKRTEVELIGTQIQSHVSGIIIVPSGGQSRVRDLLKRTGIPVLYAVAPDGAGTKHRIYFDDEEAAYAVVSRAAAGARAARVAVLAAGPTDGAARRRLSGVKNALSDAGMTDFTIAEVDGGIDRAHTVTLELLGSEDRPDLLVCLSDYFAIAALRAAFDAGLSVPEEVAVTGLGETAYSHTCARSLATVRFDSRELGRRAGDTMVRLIAGERVERAQKVGFEIVPGESCRLAGTEAG